MPKDEKGEIIHLHTAAYNGQAAALSSYILQGGDLEVRCSPSRDWKCSESGCVVLVVVALLLPLLPPQLCS